jgi:hypothetical protein
LIVGLSRNLPLLLEHYVQALSPTCVRVSMRTHMDSGARYAVRLRKRSPLV